LSIKAVSFTNGRVDWIDQHFSPDREIVIPLHGISGSLNRTEPATTFSLNLAGRLGEDKSPANQINMDGLVSLAADLSGPELVRIRLATKSLHLKTLQTYFPKLAAAQKLDSTTLRCDADWKKGQPLLVSFEANLKGSQEKPLLNLEGKVLAAADLSGIGEVSASAEADSLPMASLRDILPTSVPLDPESGVIKGKISGKWTHEEKLSAEAAFSVDDAAPVGPWKVAGNRLSLWVKAGIRPDVLVIHEFEISEPRRLAAIRGRIGDPLSSMPVLDLNGETSFSPSWTTALGFALPDGLRIERPVPVRGSLQGRIDKIWFDLTADVTNTPIHWGHYLEKAAGKKGSLSVKGTFQPAQGKGLDAAVIDAASSLDMAGALIRLASQRARPAPCFLHFDGKVSVRDKRIGVKNAVIAVRRESDGRDILKAGANVSDLGSPDVRFEGNATTTFDSSLLDLAGVSPSLGVVVKGNSPLSTRFSSSRSVLNWSLDLPVTPLEVTVGSAFRKPAGVRGNLSASGKWSAQQLNLEKAELALPGVSAAGRGLIMDSNSNFRELTIDLRKGNVEHLARYVPPMSSIGLSGSMEASTSLKPGETGIVPAGSVRLLDVSCHPEKAAWSLEHLQGIVDFKGDSVTIPEVEGTAAGFIQGPFKVSGSMAKVTSSETANGKISLNVRKGRIKADRLTATLSQARMLAGTFLDPQLAERRGDLLDFDFLSGDFYVKSGVAHTDNLRLKGPQISAGAIGSLRLDTALLDAFVGLRTRLVAGAALAQIPAVQQLIKKHEALLKGIGIDKELKRYGIQTPEPGRGEPAQPDAVGAPITVILKIKGPASSPQVVPVLEAAIEKTTASRLGTLLD
jgi:hypothetical protein